MNLSKEVKFNIFFATLLILVGETWELSLEMIFSSSFDEWKKINLGGILFLITFNIAYFSVYALNYVVFAPRYLKFNKVPHYAISIVVMILCFAGIRFLLEEIITPYFFGIHNYNLDQENIVTIYLVDSIGYALRPCLFSSLVYLFFRYTENKKLVHDLKIQHQEAKMAMFQSQIGPHFLFNTLNGFYSDLYDKNPKIADGILKLSQLLRYVTYEVKQDAMPLKKEVEFIKDYLFFYKRRYENHFYVTFNVEGEMKNQEIPPLILIHFVENVCKHGIIDNSEEPAIIKIKINESSLEMTTENSINKSEKYMDKGVGSRNVKNRLDILLEENYDLNYDVKGSKFNTYLRMPL